MSFSFGGSSSNSSNSFNGTDNYNKSGTTNQTTNTSQTMAPTNPDWVSTGAQGIWGGAQALGGQNPQNYVAGPDGLQTNAAATAWGLNPHPQGYSDATNFDNLLMTQGKAPQTEAVTASPYISNYMNPYMSSVVDATKADMDAQAGQTRAQQSLDLARSGAFGGSGAAIDQSLTEGQLSRALGTTLGNLRYQGYDTAAQNAQQDAQRAQSANDLNAQLHGQMQDRRLQAARDQVSGATAEGQNARDNIASQAAVGGQLQQIAQTQAQSPLALQSWQQQLFSGLPTQLFNGQTQTGTQDQTGTQTETGTEDQSGTSKGKNSGFNFGFSTKSS